MSSGMLGSRCRIAEVCRAESDRRGRSRSQLTGKGGVALRRFSQTCRDLFRDPGAFLSPKQIIFGQARMNKRRLHEGVAIRFLSILQTKCLSGKKLNPMNHL